MMMKRNMKKLRSKKRMKGKTYSRKRHHIHNTDSRKRKKMTMRRNVTKRKRKRKRKRKKENERAGTFKKKAPCSKAGCKRATARKVVHDYFGTDIFRSGRATRPKNPYFVTKIRAKRRDQLYIPIDVVRDYKLELPSSMTIRDPADRKFGTKLKSWKDGKIWLHGGWHNLCRWNLVGKDDSCICEFVRGKGKKALHLQRIPAWFLRHISEESPDKATLKCVSEGTWNVKLQCDEDGLLIHKGWEKFQKNNQLEEGDFLVFTYDGGLQFTVRFFSKNGLEREVKSTAKIKKLKYLIRPETPKGQQKSSNKAEDLLTPNIPQFVKCLKGYNVNKSCFLYVPKSLTEQLSDSANKTTVILRNSEGKEWKVNCLTQKGYRAFCGGWKQFVSDNKLKEGHICVFQLVMNTNELGREKNFLHGVLETASHISAMYDRTGEDFRGIGSSFAAVQSVSSAVLLVLFTRQQVLVCISEQNFMK
ncbi:hypothetical protein K7X08_009387 [Anisodus acutangulus]|uniref:TF-B3 domain-containing protein n=1 Tax=Anisodus acutangulus TaxID=402998 RepID=A0A9Q1N0T0_9SOLA|nr:hypothetical protein K7X08_009387 [Anisodus acutangulus]